MYDMDNKVIRIISVGFFLLTIAIILFFSLKFGFEEIKTMEYYNYPVISYRYFETQGILFNGEKIEVIYKTDSETVKETYFVSSIKIGKKTEVIVQEGKNIHNFHSELYMTKDDYESLFSSAVE